MEYIVVVLLLALAGWWLYRAGKRRGSRQGYSAGRARRRRNRHR